MRPAAPILPAFMSPVIRHEAPLWHARIPYSRATVDVRASTKIEAKFAAAKLLGAHVQTVLVELAYDPELLRFGRLA